jgi:Na+-translocating ferredoxin:NAD+ oxidoreductase RnfC subunit
MSTQQECGMKTKTRPRRAVYWRCFHCGDTFTKAQAKHARDHFGRDCSETPVCLIREPGEYHVLRALRDAQDDLAAYRAEDTELHRALYAMSSEHRQALIREEEKGYARGLRDGMQEIAA